MQDIVEYGEDTSGVLGHIVVEAGNAMVSAPLDYSINDAAGIVQVLSKILSPEETSAAKHSPLLGRTLGYQSGGGQPPKTVKMGDDAQKDLFRVSGDRSIDGEMATEDGEVRLTGLKAEPTVFAKWCGWFKRCCPSSPETNPLLDPDPKSSLTSSK